MDLAGVRAGGGWSSSRASTPAPNPANDKALAYYDDTRHLVYGRNHVRVEMKTQKLRGYLALYSSTRPGCGPLLSWVPFSVLRGIKRNNPDVDKEILVQLHNVSSLVVRTFPLLPRAETATMEVIVYGVDGNPYPGFRFPEGGAEAFMAAVSQEYVIEEVGEMTSPAGLRDQTYNLGKPKSKGKGKNPCDSPTHSAPGSPQRPKPKPTGNIFQRMFRLGASDPRAAGPAQALEPLTLEERIEGMQRKRHQNQKRDLLVAWRLFAYRRRKIRLNVASLVTRTMSTSRFPWAHLRPAGETTRTSAELDNGLTEDLWASLLDPETGAVTDQVAFYSAIALGGVCDGRRGVAWRLLLQEYGLHHGEAERSARDAEVEAAYHAQSTEYKLAALTKVDTKLSLSRFIEHCDVIDQDVERSDFHEDETGEFPRMLRSILRTYVWHNPDTGYVQGMLDLLEPILYVVGVESSAHYCFTHLLQRAGPKFDRGAETGIEAFMSKLRCLLAYEEPELGEHLRFLDADHLFFTYRWFLLDFKREFEKEDVLKIWESIWACEILHSEHITVFIALVVLQEHRVELLQCANSTDLLRLFNVYGDSKLVANVVMRQAMAIMMRLKANLIARGMRLDQN